MILPSMSCHGLTVASRISTIRFDFSSITPGRDELPVDDHGDVERSGHEEADDDLLDPRRIDGRELS